MCTEHIVRTLRFRLVLPFSLASLFITQNLRQPPFRLVVTISIYIPEVTTFSNWQILFLNLIVGIII